MNKFIFKLEPLYDYRHRIEEICMKEFGEALGRLDEEEGKLAVLKGVYKKSSEEADRLKEEGAPVEDINMYHAWFAGLRNHIVEQEGIIRHFRAELEAKRARLLEASKDKKVIETLKEKSFESYRQELSKQDQKTTDDIVNGRFDRKKRL